MPYGIRSYNIVIKTLNGEPQPFEFGEKGGVELGVAKSEPSVNGVIDTILIQSLHHGAGRLLNTDPFCYRDGNGDGVAADAAQFGFIMPGGDLTSLASQAVTTAVPEKLGAASFVDRNGRVVFAAGRQLFRIDPAAGDAITLLHTLGAGEFFTGSVASWKGEFLLPYCNVSGDLFPSAGVLRYPGLTTVTSADYKASWIVSNSTALYWIQNYADGSSPGMRWSDDSENVYGAFSAALVFPPTGSDPFRLDVPMQEVTGMGVAGIFPIFATADKLLWAFDPTEVFTPMTPLFPQRRDQTYGRQMPYVKDWLLAPHDSGMLRFDPSSLRSLDITPGVHQGAHPTFTPSQNLAVEAACSTPTGAALITRYGSDSLSLVRLEVYEDGMFYAIAYQNLDIGRGLAIVHSTSASVARYPRLYLLGLNASGENFRFFRLDLNGPGAQRRAENVAATSQIRTVRYSSRPPDVSTQAVQLRGAHAHASPENPITISLEIDGNDGSMLQIGQLTKDGPFALRLPAGVIPGRRYALVYRFDVGENADPPFISLPNSLDYIYSQQSSDLGADFVTLKFEIPNDNMNRTGSGSIQDARSVTEMVVGFQGQVLEVEFADRMIPWKVECFQAEATLLEQADGAASTSYLATLECRRIQ